MTRTPVRCLTLAAVAACNGPAETARRERSRRCGVVGLECLAGGVVVGAGAEGCADAVAVELLAHRAEDGADGEADAPFAEVLDDAGEDRPARAAPRMAAVAESAPTTRCRDEPSTAKAAIGSSSVDRPVTTGIPAIFAYPRATGMLTAARVIPASTSGATCDRWMGSSPPITGSARSRARTEPHANPASSPSPLPGGPDSGNHPAATTFGAAGRSAFSSPVGHYPLTFRS